jgi:tetratricopeptide (TPR) repeat protein
MKSILHEIQTELLEFINNRDCYLLIVPCEIEHSAFLLKSIESFEQHPAVPDIYLTFGYEFEDQTSYIEEILAEVGQQLNHVGEELAKRGGDLNDKLVGTPNELEDHSLPPVIRLAKVIERIRMIVPKDCHVIWVLYPTEIYDPAQYLQMIAYLKDHVPKHSLSGTKLIVRDDASFPILVPRLEEVRGTSVYRTRLDPESFEKMLTAKANDRAIPAEERAQMHMMIAGYDVAHRRFDLALSRNRELLNYFAYANQPYNRSIVLNNIGDLFYIQERWPEATVWYRRAIGASVELGSQPLVFNQSINLGNALVMQNNYTEALIYYHAAEKYAGLSGMFIQQIEVLERIGFACRRSGAFKEAAEALEKAAMLNEKIKNHEGQQSNLEQLRQIYSEMGDERRFRQNQAKLSALIAVEKERNTGEDEQYGDER